MAYGKEDFEESNPTRPANSFMGMAATMHPTAEERRVMKVVGSHCMESPWACIYLALDKIKRKVGIEASDTEIVEGCSG
eukprot:g42152.t1